MRSLISFDCLAVFMRKAQMWPEKSIDSPCVDDMDLRVPGSEPMHVLTTWQCNRKETETAFA